ncbi:MAG: hypothetical protein ACTS7D_01450 [Candidatus Hodgkinia cicadicola]
MLREHANGGLKFSFRLALLRWGRRWFRRVTAFVERTLTFGGVRTKAKLVCPLSGLMELETGGEGRVYCLTQPFAVRTASASGWNTGSGSEVNWAKRFGGNC